jgi:hypothetical protein
VSVISSTSPQRFRDAVRPANDVRYGPAGTVRAADPDVLVQVTESVTAASLHTVSITGRGRS